MILGYEQPVEMPTMDIYSTDLMKAYIAGVKEQYDNAREDYKDFMKTYGDFYSPIAGDTEAYYNLTVGGAQNLLDQMYEQGIDPLRNPEARAMISRYIASVPTGKLAQMKQSADNAKEYLKNRADLQSKGLWNPEYEKWLLGGKTIENWNTATDGMWNRLSPNVYQDLHDYTDDWFKHLEKKYDEELTKQKNDGYDYYTVSEKDLRDVINGKIPDIINDGGLGSWYYYQALQKAGGDPTKAMELFKDDIVSRNTDYLRIEPKVNEYKKMAQEFNYDAALKGLEHRYHQQEEQTRHANTMIENGKQEDGGVGSYFTTLFKDGQQKNQYPVQSTSVMGAPITTTRQEALLDQYWNPGNKQLFKSVPWAPTGTETDFSSPQKVINMLSFPDDHGSYLKIMKDNAGRKINDAGQVALNLNTDIDNLYTAWELMALMKGNKRDIKLDRNKSKQHISKLITNAQNKDDNGIAYANPKTKVVQFMDINGNSIIAKPMTIAGNNEVLYEILNGATVGIDVDQTGNAGYYFTNPSAGADDAIASSIVGNKTDKNRKFHQ